jgi:hypothetical protein
MAYLTKIILPNNLRSESLRAEFLELGQNYINNHYSEDFPYDYNYNTLKFKFEVRDAATRSTVYQITKIKELLISNDPEFTESSTLKVTNLPDTTYDPTQDYYINIDQAYTHSFILGTGVYYVSNSGGNGYFVVQNWPLSANGGLSTVYLKAILYVNDEEVTYPNSGGIFDQIYWAGELPATPSLNEYSSLKSGWTGADSLVTFKESNDLQTSNGNAVSSYIGSFIEIYNYNNSLNYTSQFAQESDNFLSLGYGKISSIDNLNLTAHRFYRTGSSNPSPSAESFYNSPCSAEIGSPYSIYHDGSGFTQGFTLDGTTGLTLNSTNNSYYFQTQVNTDIVGLGNNYFLSIFLCIRTSTVHNQDKIITKIVLSDNYIAPTSYIYFTNSSGYESSEYQRTDLPPFLQAEMLRGGVYETYLQVTEDGNNYIVESYYTPNIDSTLPDNLKQKSYLLGRVMMPEMTSISGYYPSIGVYYDGTDTNGLDVTVKGMLAASGSGVIAADLGDCRKEDFNSLNFPISSIEGSWSTYFDEEMSDVIWQSASPVQKDTTKLTFTKLNKYIFANALTGKQYHEVQFSKPSLSNRASLTFEFQHNCDEMYVAFAPNLLYSGSRLLPIGLNCDPDFAFTDQELNHECIVVNFSALRNEISVTQRNADNTLSYYVLRSYKPLSTSRDLYTIEITDFHPEGLAGTTSRSSANATWVNIKRNNNIIGFIQLSRKLNPGINGLGYYCGIGFRTAEYGTSSSLNYIHKVDFRSLPGIESNYFSNPQSIRTFLLSDKGASKNKPYLGQALINSSTDLAGFNYETPLPYDNTPLNVKCATSGGSYSAFTSNGNLLYVPSSTYIDNVDISTLSIGDYILIKDQDTEGQNKVYSIQSLNPSTNTTTLLGYSISSYKEINVTGGQFNAGTTWYPIKTGNIYNFYSTLWFKDIESKYNKEFYNSQLPRLLEFKLNWTYPDKSFPQDKLKIRFFVNNTNTNLPDYAFSDWIDISNSINQDTFTAKSNNNLIQVVIDIEETFYSYPPAKYWVAISLPMGCSLAEANGINYNNESVISSGNFKGWNLATNLWYKVFNSYTKTRKNSSHNSVQQFRVSALTHSNLSSHATNLSLPVTVDINAPSYTGSTRPLLSLYDKSTVRTATFKIEASDDDSGILAFRFGKETDYGLVYFEPWQSWSLFKNHNDDNLYTVYLHGSQRYDYAGAELGYLFSNMNIGFSGARKVWVQLMDYAGNISESYPQAFVAQSIAAMDTEAPFGNVSFYNLESNQEILLTNKKDSWLKINASDDVSGIKDFRYRKVTNEGPGEWSNWMMFNSYAPIKFTGEEDGVKKVEVAFRDYGNNITQPEYKWHKVLKVKK